MFQPIFLLPSIPEQHEKRVAAIEFMKTIDNEIASFYNFTERSMQMIKHYSKHALTTIGTAPHLIVWARLIDFSYWPAKVLGTTKYMVHVCFFGTNDDENDDNCINTDFDLRHN